MTTNMPTNTPHPQAKHLGATNTPPIANMSNAVAAVVAVLVLAVVATVSPVQATQTYTAAAVQHVPIGKWELCTHVGFRATTFV